MPPRGLKKILKDTVPAKLTGKGKWRGFADSQGRKLRGLHPALTERVWSKGALPSIAKYGTVKRGGWKGKGGGRKRGAAVDAQLSKAVNRGKAKPTKGQYTLTKLALAALQEHCLEPVASQRAVCSSRLRLGTAIDVLCYEPHTSRLVVVELKCGFSGSKEAAAQKNGKACKMQSPLGHAPDNTLNRHLSQLAVTRQLFASEKDTLARLQTIGIRSDVGGALLYVNDEATELYTLDDWWVGKAEKMMSGSVLNF